MFRSITRVSSRNITGSRLFSVSSIVRNETTAASTNNIPKSSCPAGTVLNLKVFKKGEEPVAKEDSEYPEWLWTMVDPKANLDAIQSEDFFRWRKIKIGKENSKTIKKNNFMSKV
ncbi:MRPL37 54S ribosomal protein L37 [Candida maltosa Xu316]